MAVLRSSLLMAVALVVCGEQRAAGQTIDDLLGDGRARWLRFQVVDGRIHSESPYFGRFRSYSGNNKTQRLTIGANPMGVGVIRFNWSNDERAVVAEATATGEVTITDSPKGEDKSGYRSFTQPSRGAVVLSYGSDDARQRIEAATIWHLQLEHPQVSRAQLYPLLAVLRNEWNWEQNIENLRDELFRLAKAHTLPDQARWARLVEQLASDKFVERQRAERLLRGFGRAVVPYLQSLDRAKLDAEQEFRIRRIVEESYRGSDDTPGRVATWLVGDPRIWLALLPSEDIEQRRLAAAQLKQLVGDTFEFTPDADAKKRNEQIEKMREAMVD